MKSRFVAELIVVMLLFGTYTSMALPSQSQYNGEDIVSDSSGNYTPRVYTMKIYVGDSKNRQDELKVEAIPYGISPSKIDGTKGAVSDLPDVFEFGSPGSRKFLNGLVSSLFSNDLAGDSLNFGSMLDLGGSGAGSGLSSIQSFSSMLDLGGSGIPSITSMIQSFSGVLSIFTNILARV